MKIGNWWVDSTDTDSNRNINCCGCGACENVCVSNCISMQYDKEGFLYPVVDNDRCIECGKCVRVCPIRNVPQQLDYEQAYAGYSLNTQVIDKCASGGICTEISRHIINQGGIVFGVTYSSDYIYARYDKAETLDELGKFMTSKYVQSEKKSIFKQVVKELEKGRRVCFIGCPCDIAALHMYIGKDYQSLLTIELICMGVTSYKVAESYIKKQEKKYGKIVLLNSKNKKYGWFVPSLEEQYSSGRKKVKPFFGTYYGYGFTQFQRPSCGSCKYRGKIGYGDLRVGDFWGIKKTDAFWNEKGVSSIFARTKKGKDVLLDIDSDNFKVFEVPYEKASINNNMDASKNYNEKQKKRREKFAKKFLSKGIVAACRCTATWEFWVKHLVSPNSANFLKHLRHLVSDVKSK